MSAEAFDDIDGFLETENCLSVRWLANSLRLTVANAQRLMADYKENRPNISVSYLISGYDCAGCKSFKVATDKSLDDTKQSFSSVNSVGIYGIQKESTESINQQLAVTDCDQSVDLLLMNHPNSSEFLRNKLGKINLVCVDIKPVGERVRTVQAMTQISDDAQTNSNSQTVLKKETAENHINRVFANKTTAPPLKSKSSIQASSFFSKMTSVASAQDKNKVNNVTVHKEKTPPSKETTSAVISSETVQTVARPKNVQEDDGEDAEWDDGSGHVPTKRSHDNSRKKTITIQDEEEGEGSEKDSGDKKEEDEEEESATKKQKKSKTNAHVHGAMDTYMEDVAIAEYKNSVATAEEGGGDKPVVKRTKKKLVEKMFVDEKGYLVTETVMEDVTDDEGDRASTVKVTPPIVSRQDSQNSTVSSHDEENGKVKEKKAPVKAAPAKKKDTSAPPQKNMMSFFGKK